MSGRRWSMTLIWTVAVVCPVWIIAIALITIRSAPQDWWAIPMYGLIVTTWGSAGAFLIGRRPGNRVGWLLWVTGAGVGLSLAGQAWAYLSIETFEASLPGTVVGAVLGVLFLPTLTLITLVPMVFPDGRFLSRRWAVAGMLILLDSLMLLVGSGLQAGPIEGTPEIENPLGVAGLADLSRVLTELASLLVLPALLVGVLAAVVRYRRGSQMERNQFKWLGSSAVLAFVMFFAATVIPQPYGQWAWVAGSVSIGLLPLAIGVAVLRYRLYEIDRLISRTIGWALVTGLLLAAFVLLVLALSELLRPLTGEDTLAVAASTLVVAALFGPLRARVQRAVDRRFDRARYDGERLLDELAERLRDEVDLEVIRADLLATADAAVRPSSLGLWLRAGGEEGA